MSEMDSAGVRIVVDDAARHAAQVAKRACPQPSEARAPMATPLGFSDAEKLEALRLIESV
jgi:hypothetical protein